NSCCGVSPCRRATSDTTTPGARLSRTIRALASRVNRRLRPAPVIISTRCKVSSLFSVVGSSVSSCLCSNRCLLMGRYHAHEHTRGEGGSRHPLTERWLRFFDQNLRVVKWELLPG